MAYIVPIKAAIAFFPFLALIFTLPFMIHQYRKYGSLSFLRALIIYSFILYLLTVYFLVILPLPKISEVTYMPNMVRLIPFGFLGDIVRESSFVWNDPSTYITALMEPCVYTVLFNVLMTVPFGMYLRYYFRYDFKKTCFSSFFLSLFFELTQLSGLYFIYPYPYRVFDVDDLIVNTLGGVLGYLLMGMIERFLPSRERIDEKSKERGKSVSGLRRIFIFFLDLFFSCLFLMILSFFIPKEFLLFVSYSLYYLIFPLFFQGTMGSLFLKVKLEFKNKMVLRSVGYFLFLLFYYFFLPILVSYFSFFLLSSLHLEILFEIFLFFLLFLGLFLFYLVNIIVLLKTKRMFYDTLFQVEYKSVVEE